MNKQRKALAQVTAGWIRDILHLDRETILELTDMLKSIVTSLVLPVILCLIGIRIAWEVMSKIIRYVSPPSAYQRHMHARYLYRKGRIDSACAEWNELLSVENGIFFGPSALSLACHEIYVNRNYQKGIIMLKQAQQRQQLFQSTYGNSPLSTEKGTRLDKVSSPTKNTRKQDFLRMNRKKVDALMMDAEAYLHGDGIMVERMNAPQAKLEHLGISTSDAALDTVTAIFSFFENSESRRRTEPAKCSCSIGNKRGATSPHHY